MKTTPGLSAASIRALSRHLADQLATAGAGLGHAQPGRLFFPKRTHELSSVDGDAPDGLGVAYVALAARLNTHATAVGTPDLLATLLRTVEAEITRARITEARLIEAMGRAT